MSSPKPRLEVNIFLFSVGSSAQGWQLTPSQNLPKILKKGINQSWASNPTSGSDRQPLPSTEGEKMMRLS